MDWHSRARAAGAAFHVRHSERRWAHNLCNATACALIAGGVLAVLAAGGNAGPTYVLWAGPLLGLLFYTAIALLVHEASHGLLFLAADRRVARALNRAVGIACCLPFAIPFLQHWERGHDLHHRYPLEERDPQRFNTLQGAQLWRTVALLVLVPGFVVLHRYGARAPGAQHRSTRGTKLAALVLWTAIAPLLVALLSGWAALAVLMGIGSMSALNQVKGSLEHGGLASVSDPLLRSRSMTGAWSCLLAPWWATAFHFEHHLDPEVPWYRLPAYHRSLQTLVPSDLLPLLGRRT